MVSELTTAIGLSGENGQELIMADIVALAQPQEQLEMQAALRQALAPPAGCEMSPLCENGVPHCRICDDVIPEARLAAVPNTGLCVSCAAMVQGMREPARIN